AAGTPAEDSGEDGGGEEVASTEITVDMVDIAFEPTEFEIPAGTEATINLVNSGNSIHDFTIEALGINEVLDPGAETSITVTADVGDFDYICTQPGHKEAGMVGVMHAVEGGDETAAGGASPVASPGASPVASPAGAEAAAAGAEVAATEVSVDMVDIAFEPTSFSIPAGTDVTVTLTNSGAALHDFTIEALDIHEVVDPGAETTITINADAGDYDYICTQPGHKESGMVGVMTVQ
ncbi:MAG: cupredoxin domain-containing protein, partial [Thermomicrobiales bacterium]